MDELIERLKEKLERYDFRESEHGLSGYTFSSLTGKSGVYLFLLEGGFLGTGDEVSVNFYGGPRDYTSEIPLRGLVDKSLAQFDALCYQVQEHLDFGTPLAWIRDISEFDWSKVYWDLSAEVGWIDISGKKHEVVNVVNSLDEVFATVVMYEEAPKILLAESLFKEVISETLKGLIG